MKTNRTTWILFPALSLLLAAGTLWAFQGPQGTADDPAGPPRARPEASGGPRGGGMMEELGLTDQQRQQMRALHSEHRKAAIRSRADLELKRLELNELLEADEPNQPALDNTIRELNDLRAASFKRRIDQRLAFRRLLTPEQRTKLRSVREHRGGSFRHHMRQRWMDGSGSGRGQRRGPGSGRGQGSGPRGGFGPGSGGGPDFDLEPEFDPEPEL